MPISRKTFEAGNFKTKKKASFTEHPIAIFLSKNSDKAYTVKEIIKAVRMKEDTVRSMLATLKKKKVIIHKTPHFIWKEAKKKR